MSSQSSDRYIDLDRQISERDARIRSNPRDAVAYRERGVKFNRPALHHFAVLRGR